MDNFARHGEIILRQVQRTEAEFIQSIEDPHGVLADRPYEQVDIAGKARCTVKGQSVASDDELFNFVLVEQLEQLFEVCVKLHNNNV